MKIQHLHSLQLAEIINKLHRQGKEVRRGRRVMQSNEGSESVMSATYRLQTGQRTERQTAAAVASKRNPG